MCVQNLCFFFFFFFNDTATTEIYTLSLHDALPIYGPSDTLDSLGNRSRGGEEAATLEDDVLDEMAEPAGIPPLMARAHAEHERHRGGPALRHRRRDEPGTVGQ